MWTFGLHGGGRFNLSANSVLTPYLDYDYVNSKMDGFIENGSSGAELHLASNSDKHSFLTGGVKWATQMGGVVPEVALVTVTGSATAERTSRKRSSVRSTPARWTSCRPRRSAERSLLASASAARSARST